MTKIVQMMNFNDQQYNNNYSTFKTRQMTSIKSHLKTHHKETRMKSQQKIQAPLVRKDSSPCSRLLCQNHSSASKNQFIKFININYFEPYQRKKKIPIKIPFLCETCLSEVKNKRISKEVLQYIKSLQQFQTQYIESVFKMYNQEKQLDQKISLIEKTQEIFNQEIDRIASSFNLALQNYKNLFKEIFDSIIEPFNQENIYKFRKGQFNQEIIRQLYKGSKKAGVYSSLIGQNYQLSLKFTCDGLKQSLEEIQKLMKRKLFESQHNLKNVIKICKAPELIDELKNMDMNVQNQGQSQGRIWQRIKSMKEERKKLLSRKKELRQRSLSQNRQRNSSEENEKQQRTVPQFDKKKIPIQQRSTSLKKHKIIRKQRLQKPSRCSDVHVIGEHYLLKENKIVVLYMVNKTHTEKVQSQVVNRMPSEEFKRKYPEAYRTFQKDEYRKRQKQ